MGREKYRCLGVQFFRWSCHNRIAGKARTVGVGVSKHNITEGSFGLFGDGVSAIQTRLIVPCPYKIGCFGHTGLVVSI